MRAKRSAGRPLKGCRKKLGSSKEPQTTGFPPRLVGMGWRRSEKRKRERRARMRAERRTGLVGIGKAVADKIAGIVGGSLRTPVETDRLV